MDSSCGYGLFHGDAPMVEVDCFFGLGSRYSYLAFTQLQRLEAAHGCKFIHYPLSSVDLMEMRGRSPFRGPPLSGQYEWDYRQRDAEAWAEYYGVPYLEPLPLPEDHRLMARACYAAALQNALRGYCAAMFAAVFVRRQSITRRACSQIASDIGLDDARFRKDIDSAATNDAVTSAARRAYERGAFGVPTFVVDGRIYWGNDRIVLLGTTSHAVRERIQRQTAIGVRTLRLDVRFASPSIHGVGRWQQLADWVSIVPLDTNPSSARGHLPIR